MNPVKINDTTYEVTLPGGDKVEVGDRDALDFKPCAKLKRWGEECSLVLSIPTAEKILPTVQDDKILWQGRDYGAEFFAATDGFKFNIILPEKPGTNVFPLDFGSENLDFYYQPSLTEEFQVGWSDEFQCEIAVTETDVTRVSDGQVLVHRPADVVGSYAVYHATKGNVHAGQAEAEKYKTGKAFHWYRPLIWDSAGKTCWGILNVDPKLGLRTVTVPQTFLDNAVYPVTIDDTFGYTSVGGSSQTRTSGLTGYRFTGAAGTASSMSYYGNFVSGTCGFGVGIYKHSDYSHVAHAQGSMDDTEEWHNFTISASVEEIDYYLVFCAEGGSQFKAFYDSGDTNYALYENDSGYDDWDDPLPSPYTSFSNRFSIYCTYTPSGGGGEKTGSDAGTGADARTSGNPLVAIGGSETGSGLDALPARDIALPDSGSGVDAFVSLQTPSAKTSSDVGSGVEAVPVYGAALAGSESGSGIEAFIAWLLAAAESGYGAEASEIGGGGLLKKLFASELGEGADGLTAKIEMPTKGGGMRLWT